MKAFEDHKTSLTPAEKLRVAVAVLNDGWEPHRVAALLGVNPGLIEEAVNAVRPAVEMPRVPDLGLRPPLLGMSARIAGLSAVDRALGVEGGERSE